MKRLALHRVDKIRISPKESSVVVFDLQDDLRDILPVDEFEIFDPRYGTIFLYPLLKGWLKWVGGGRSGSLTERYFIEFLRLAGPNLVVTTIDNNSVFYSGKKDPRMRGVRFIAIQNGCRWIETMPESASFLEPEDTIVCLTRDYVQAWQAIAPKAKILPLGTFASKRPVQAPAPALNHVGFISTWKIGDVINGVRMKKTYRENFVPHSEFYSPEILLLPLLLKSLRELGLTLDIIARSTGEEAAIEKAFYNGILGEEGWTFVAREKTLPSYSTIQRYKLLFCVTSTLAYEALALGQHVMFLEVRPLSNDKGGLEFVRQPFGYPDSTRVKNLDLHLCERKSNHWVPQIRRNLLMSSKELREAALQIVGEEAMSTSLADLRAFLAQNHTR